MELPGDVPLPALRVLLVCARSESFTRAALELGVAQASVSYQIKLLEQSLKLKLFARNGAGVVLTDAGARYVDVVRRALLELDSATGQLRAGTLGASLVCNVATTIGLRWLVPRLRKFSLQFPDIALTLNMTEQFMDFAKDEVDIGIWYGAGEWPGLVSTLLFQEVLVPVCSPEFLKKFPDGIKPRSLAGITLLHSRSTMNDWGNWLEARGITGIDAHKGLVFEQPHFAMQAAAEGVGIAMADRMLAQPDLHRGRLVIPIHGGLARTTGYYLVGQPAAPDGLRSGKFWRWLVAEALDVTDSAGSEYGLADLPIEIKRPASPLAGARGDRA
jgi:LysR family transcriptional regulator, glycine cleavage system transcriptional activator